MHLVMFDIDGTLTQSNNIDATCFVDAVKEVLGLQDVDSDWSGYRYVTDAGIASEIVEKYMGRMANKCDLLAIRDLFVKKLYRKAEDNPQLFKATSGAPELISYLCESKGIAVALATGGWRDSALLKLQIAGIEYKNIPMASSDDSHERESILTQAYELARNLHDIPRFENVTYVGDGVWDITASKNLGYDFIGIGVGDQAEILRNEGATCIMDDFIDKDRFLSLTGITLIRPPAVKRKSDPDRK